MRIKAIFFDLFETLISEFENGSRKAPRSTLLEEQLQVDAKRYREEWNSRQEKRMDGTYTDFPSVVKEILDVLDHRVDDEIIETLHKERITAKAIPFSNIDKNIILMLEELKQLGLKVCLISNCTPEEVTAWHTSELAKYFDDALFSYEVKLAKPNPQIYHLACDRLGVSPEESLFVGDGGSNELNGATNVGMNAYHATWFIPPYISERISDYPKLTKPAELINLTRKLAL
ncbi:HAD-IA family hydrolase [Paenibacillus lupini]|uniref:HAD family hydrolase n=1 Tax=Paenibacillus lupini TaxID=1450204 RepID=UPI001420D28F|nr:HAD-IA family hydrolase [Paenibacillus lupini]NIK21781.1 putative hydrolase of the HAD superfamily [Paenibacillus lupini]